MEKEEPGCLEPFINYLKNLGVKVSKMITQALTTYGRLDS